MTARRAKPIKRNWLLAIVAGIWFVMNTILVLVAVVYWAQWGWWVLAPLAFGLPSIVLSAMAIKTNNPAWLLLDLVLPG